jgi:hypothetical protein
MKYPSNMFRFVLMFLLLFCSDIAVLIGIALKNHLLTGYDKAWPPHPVFYAYLLTYNWLYNYFSRILYWMMGETGHILVPLCRGGSRIIHAQGLVFPSPFTLHYILDVFRFFIKRDFGPWPLAEPRVVVHACSYGH